MARRKYSNKEVEQWREEHHQSVFYINKNDSNLFIKRRSNALSWTLNLTHPAAWIIIAAVITLIVVVNIFLKSIRG